MARRGFSGGRSTQYHGAAVTRVEVRAEMSGIEKRGDDGPTVGIVVKAKPKTKKPSMYKVLMLNDDYTPM
jgi:ATP-dependent Clp protease adaptor protein ClpS